MDFDPHLPALYIPCAIFLPETVACAGIVILLLVLSAVVSAAEAGFMSLPPDAAKKWETDSRARYRRICALMRKPEKLLATMQVAGAFANVAIVVVAAYAVSSAASGRLTAGVAALATAGIVLLILVFGKIVPRMYASQNAAKALLRPSLLLLALQKIFYPPVAVLTRSTSAVRKYARTKQSISIGDLSGVLDKTPEAAGNDSILKRIVKFGNIGVHTVMTSRTDVEAVDIAAGLAELMENINEWGYSRIPVYDGTPDNVKGILYVKDLLPYIEEADDFAWQKLIRKAYFVPEHKKIDDLLKEFQEMKNHMAVIIDEYGGMAGIVTLEDILEEIVGDIADESDDDEQDYIRLDDGSYLFDGKVLLNDFFRIMHLEESDFAPVRGEADTLAGVILEIKGEIPQKGECVDYMHLSFCVESADNRRIQQIKVIAHEPEKK